MSEAVGEALQALRELAAAERPAVAELPRFADAPAAERAAAEALGPWEEGPFWLGDDLVVGADAGSDRRWPAFLEVLPALEGARVLDHGDSAGFDAFTFKRAGAAQVVASGRERALAQLRFLEQAYGAGVEIGPLPTDGSFDVIHCHGAFNREPFPEPLLKRLAARLAPGGLLLLGARVLIDPEQSDYALYDGDAWYPGRLALRWMLETEGFSVTRPLALDAAPAGSPGTVLEYVGAQR